MPSFIYFSVENPVRCDIKHTKDTRTDPWAYVMVCLFAAAMGKEMVVVNFVYGRCFKLWQKPG